MESLRGGSFHDLLGAVEDEYLDFKTAPYAITTEKGKRDLAEDVAKFATAAGGILVLGVATVRSDALNADVAQKLHLFPEEHIDLKQYHDVIADWIIPGPQGVEVKWYRSSQTAEGLAAVVIRSQPQDLQPFVVKRALVDDTGKTAGAYVGIFERVRAHAMPMSAEEIQRLLRDGRRFASLFEQLELLSARVEQLSHAVRKLSENAPAPTPPPVVPQQWTPGPGVVEAGNRRGEAVRDAGLNERPTYSLIALPGEAADVPDLFAGSRHPLVQLLQQPPELRHAGFDIRVGVEPRIVAGKLRRALNPGVALLELWRDGILIFVADARGLLTHGTGTVADPLVLNVLALAETIYLFAGLAASVATHLAPPPETVQYVLGLQRMRLAGKTAVLVAGPRRHRPYAFPHEVHRAREDSVEIRTKAFPAATDPAVVAYALRRDLYAWFELDEEDIPYAKELQGQRATAPEQIIEDGETP